MYKVPTIKEIKKMCEHADLSTRTWLLCAKDSGLGNADLLPLSLSNLSSEYGTIGTQLRKGTVPVHIELRRHKTKEAIHSFFGPNAIEALKQYVNVNGRGRIFKMSARSLQQKIKALSIQTKVATKEVPVRPYCVSPTMVVITNPKLKEIQELNTDVSVLTHKGRFKVAHRMEKDYDGDLIRLHPYYTNMPLEVTPEHLILSLKSGNQAWVPASDLNVGDIVLTPRINREEPRILDLGLITTDVLIIPTKEGDLIRPKYGIIRNPIKRHVLVNQRVGRLMGYFLAEGCTNRRGLNICFSPTETDYINDSIDIVENEFGFTGYLTVARNGLYFASRILAEMFENLFGKYAWEKYMPTWVFDLPTKVRWEIIRGFLRGDGYIRNRFINNTPSAHIDTTSRSLAFQLKILFNSLGITVSVNLKHQKGMKVRIHGREVISKHDIYNVYVAAESWKRFAEALNLNLPTITRVRPDVKGLYTRLHRSMNRTFVIEDYFGTKIRAIENIHYKGKVYDLSVDDDTSYVCQGLVVHNSMRKVFNTYMKLAGVNEAIVEVMMGHSIGRVRGAYLQTGSGSSGIGIPISKLVEAYMQAYPTIDINQV
jgi:intein/homing endonuclease